MKKLMVFSVVFVLVAGGAFAIDLSADVFSGITVFNTTNDRVEDDEGNETGAPILIGGEMPRLRIEGSGGTDTFGGWIRVNNESYGPAFFGTAWWQPISQLKFTVGKNPDGLYGKEGWAGWMFYQMPSEVGVVTPHSVWGGPYFNPGWEGKYKYRNAFFGGYEGDGLMVDIMPVDVFNMTLGIPFFNNGADKEIKKALDDIMAQFNVNLNFGSISLTYWGDKGCPIVDEDSILENTGRVYLSTNITIVPNLGLDFSVGFPIPSLDVDDNLVMDNIAIGLGAKYDVNESFGFKARLLTEFAGTKTVGDDPENEPFFFGLDLLPYYAITDMVKIYLGLGLFYVADEERYNASGDLETVKDAHLGWHFNPYVQVGSEWGPTFYAGIKIYSDGIERGTSFDDTAYTPIHFELPIGFIVSF